jgi:hypothetical protein
MPPSPFRTAGLPLVVTLDDPWTAGPITVCAQALQPCASTALALSPSLAAPGMNFSFFTWPTPNRGQRRLYEVASIVCRVKIYFLIQTRLSKIPPILGGKGSEVTSRLIGLERYFLKRRAKNRSFSIEDRYPVAYNIVEHNFLFFIFALMFSA